MAPEPSPAAPDLYDRLAAEIARCAALDVEDCLDTPLFHVVSSDQPNMVWQPKSLLPGVLAEAVGTDPVVEVDTVRLTSATALYVRLRLNGSDFGPVRCVVVLNGSHSIRFSIGRGKVERRRTYAEAVFDIQRSLTATPRGLDVEILRNATLLYHARLAPHPQTARQWVEHYGGTVWRFATAPVRSTLRMRAFRVEATRHLEESFRIRSE